MCAVVGTQEVKETTMKRRVHTMLKVDLDHQLATDIISVEVTLGGVNMRFVMFGMGCTSLSRKMALKLRKLKARAASRKSAVSGSDVNMDAPIFTRGVSDPSEDWWKRVPEVAQKYLDPFDMPPE